MQGDNMDPAASNLPVNLNNTYLSQTADLQVVAGNTV